MPSPYISQPAEATAKDSFINSNAPTTNYGTDGSFYVGQTTGQIFRGLVQFDLSTIPSYASVVSAFLYLTITVDRSTTARTFRVYRMKQAWTEAGVTWNRYDGVNNWPGGAGGFGASDCENTDCGTCAYGAADSGEKTYTLTPGLIQELISGAFTNNGFMVKADTENSDCYQHSSSGGVAASRPKLVINYLEAGQVMTWSSS